MALRQRIDRTGYLPCLKLIVKTEKIAYDTVS